MVGTQRRMYMRDVLAYKAKRDMSRRETLDELWKGEFATGDYDKVQMIFTQESEYPRGRRRKRL